MNKKKRDTEPYHVKSHYQRWEPKLYNAIVKADLRKLDRQGDEPQHDFGKMERWLEVRGLLQRFGKIEELPFTWERNRRDPHKHGHGKYFRCVLDHRCVYPPLSQSEIGIDMDENGNIHLPRSHSLWGEFKKAIHASSMYSH